jgi:hypothetical protein
MAHLECPVALTAEHAEGDSANAFRVVQDTNSDWFLDFLYYNGLEAVVVSRIRVQGMFLHAMKDRLNLALGAYGSLPAGERGV